MRFVLFLCVLGLCSCISSSIQRSPNGRQVQFSPGSVERECLTVWKSGVKSSPQLLKTNDATSNIAINDFNAELAENGNKYEYAADYESGRPTPSKLDFALGHYSDRKNWVFLEAAIGPTRRTGGIFEIEFTGSKSKVTGQKQLDTTVTQKFTVGRDCLPTLFRSENVAITIDGKVARVESRTIDINPYADVISTTSKEFLQPANSIFFDINVDGLNHQQFIDFVRTLGRKKLYVPGEEQLFPVTIVEDTAGPIAGEQAKYPGATLQLFLGSQSLYKSGVFFDPQGKMAFQIRGYQIRRYHDANEWMNLTFDAPDLEQIEPDLKAEIEPGADLQASPLIVEFSTTKRLGFPNLARYWNVLSSGNESNMLMQSQAPMDYANAEMPIANPQSSGQRYLSESKTLDISSPEVERKLDKLKAKLRPEMNRAQVAEQILLFIPTILRTDDYIFQDGKYSYFSKSSEIIKRGKGICQQYANIFTALARGLGVPARSVAGLLLFDRDSIDLHAWNEIEVRKNVWLPVDPTLIQKLQFDPAHYIPLFIEHYEAHPFRPAIPDRFLDANSYHVKVARPSN
jgi:hypothetical protein